LSEPIWVPLKAVFIIHDRQVARHGGAAGVRDIRLLEAAMERLCNKFSNEDLRLEEITAAYALGIAKAHTFVGGNKRTAFVISATFMRLNGFSLCPEPLEGVQAMEYLAAGARSEEEFAKWLARLMVDVSG
jgi:death-on-curing protein